MTRKRWGVVLMVIYVFLLALTVALVMEFGAAKDEETKKIGFVMTGDSTSQRSGSYAGVRAACEAAGVELLAKENVPENTGACPQAVTELVQEGAEMIILSSPGYTQEMEPLFANYPTVTFYGIFASSTSINVDNLVSYSTRMYQARYLSGIVAGMYSKTGRIGFVATDATSEVCRNINAFTLGVRRVAPEAEVVVAWAGTEEENGLQAAWDLLWNEGVDVITYHQDQHTVVNVAEASHVACIGYYDAVEDPSELYLTCVACDWTMLYEQLIREYLRGMGNGVVVAEWLGMESNAVGLTTYSPLVSQEARDEVERARQEILSGRDVFTNEIYDNQGRLRCGEGESMTDETLVRYMDWLVEGVRVYE